MGPPPPPSGLVPVHHSPCAQVWVLLPTVSLTWLRQGAERVAFRCSEIASAGDGEVLARVVGFPLVAKESLYEESHRTKHFHERMARTQVQWLARLWVTGMPWPGL